MPMMNERAVREYIDDLNRRLDRDIPVSFHVGQVKSLIDRGELKDDKDVAKYIIKDIFKISHKLARKL